MLIRKRKNVRMKIITNSVRILLMHFLLLCSVSYSQKNSNILRLNSNSDYFCYYGGFDENTILQCQYFDLIILDINYITPQQVEDIKNGFDNISGTDDDVIVIGYLSIGEQDGNTIYGNGTGPVYWDGQKIVYENKGYASFYLDDKDRNGQPDLDPIWNSYYVNAGDSSWWKFNHAAAERILFQYHCDGLFLDLVDTGGPNSWGLPYEWTKEGMINYIEYLRKTYPEKYLLANRGIFYFDPSLPHFQYADRYRKSIDGLMIESYYAEWDWNKSQSYINPEFSLTSQHYAPLINNQAKKDDGFNVFILDYLSVDQPDHDQLLSGVINAAERDQGWLVAVSSILLDEIRYDTYHHHLNDFNPPTWKNVVGIASYNWIGDSLAIYWNSAIDQTLPIKYHLYLNEGEIDFNAPPGYQNIIPQKSQSYDYQFIIGGLDKNKTYNLCLRASDSSDPEHTDLNRKVTIIRNVHQDNLLIDGYFGDWENLKPLNTSSIPLDTAFSKDPNANFKNIWVCNDSSKIYISYQVAGIISPTYFYHVFVDTDDDQNFKSGYIYQDSASIGSEFMIESNFLYKYTGSGGTDWSWMSVSGMQKADNGNRTELSIPLNILFQNELINKRLKMIFQINKSAAPYTFMSIAPINYKEQYYEYQVTNTFTNAKEQSSNPVDFELDQNFPNPFNSTTNIKFNLIHDGQVELKIFNNLGQIVKTVIDGEYKNKGSYCYNVDLNDIPSGIYFYNLVLGNQKITKLMVLMK